MTSWNNPSHLDTLAAAYAETGNFAEAVNWLTKALESPDFFREEPEELKKARSRLKLYEAGKPYRDD